MTGPVSNDRTDSTSSPPASLAAASQGPGAQGWLTERVRRVLTTPVRHYDRCGANDADALKRHIQKGDVLLSQGDQRVSAIIKYLTQSPWSHISLYIGDELLRRGGERAERAQQDFGKEAEHLVVDVLPEGVVVTPLVAYLEYNIRLCHPYRLRPDDLESIMNGALDAIGWRYDFVHLVDLARFYLPAEFPRFMRKQAAHLGSRDRAKVICTSLLGNLFDEVGYPVRPTRTEVNPATRRGPLSWLLGRRRGGRFVRRDPSLLAPVDFDRSPYFEIVKFNVMRDGGFDYRQIDWESNPGER